MLSLSSCLLSTGTFQAGHSRITRLTDALLDGDIDRESFEERKKTLLEERLGCEAQLTNLRLNPSGRLQRLEKFVELVKSAYLLYERGNTEEKREVLRIALSNRAVYGKELDFMLVSALSAVAVTEDAKSGDLLLGRGRTFWSDQLDSLTDAKAA